jgi:hypothetical protein
MAARNRQQLQEMRTVAAQPGPGIDPLPIWFAALLASECQAKANGEDRRIRWNCFAGRAFYTNLGSSDERIEPFGIRLRGGHTLAVSWQPGDSAYTFEVFRQANWFPGWQGAADAQA